MDTDVRDLHKINHVHLDLVILFKGWLHRGWDHYQINCSDWVGLVPFFIKSSFYGSEEVNSGGASVTHFIFYLTAQGRLGNWEKQT